MTNNNTKTGNSDAIKKRILEQQAVFLEIFKRRACNISASCDAAAINRDTYYQWRKKFPEFAKACDQARDGLVDTAESQLVKNILAGKEASLFFFLCNRAPDRWQNIQKLQHTGKIEAVAQVQVVPLSKNSKNSKKGAQDGDDD